MILKSVVVDDEKRARNILKSYIEDVPYLEFVAEFKNALEALNFLRTTNIDIVFLDINMPKLSGINAAKMLGNSKIIFTTAHREFAIEGFELNAIDYLLKPISFNRFLNAVQRIPRDSELNLTKDYFDVKVGKAITRIDFSDLFYVEGLSNYVKLRTTKEVLVTYKKLSDLEEQLPKHFLRVHKCYIINLKKITSYSKEFVQINKKHIPIGITYRGLVLNVLMN